VLRDIVGRGELCKGELYDRERDQEELYEEIGYLDK